MLYRLQASVISGVETGEVGITTRLTLTLRGFYVSLDSSLILAQTQVSPINYSVSQKTRQLLEAVLSSNMVQCS